MSPIAFIDGYAASDASSTTRQRDGVLLDVGELGTVAKIEVQLPPDAGSVPLKQYAHSIILKLLNDDARSQALAQGTIELWHGHTDADLKAELRKSSISEDSVSDQSRATWNQKVQA